MSHMVADLLRRDTLHRMRPTLGDRGEAQHEALRREMEAVPGRERQRTSMHNSLANIPLDDVRHAGDESKLTAMSSVMGKNTLFDTLEHADFGLICDAMASVDRTYQAPLCKRSQHAVLACAADRSNRSILHASPSVAATSEELAVQRSATYTAPSLRFFGSDGTPDAASTGSVDALELQRAPLPFSGSNVVSMATVQEPYGAGARVRYKALRYAKEALSRRSITHLPSWMRRCLPVSQSAVNINAAAISSVWFALVASLDAGLIV